MQDVQAETHQQIRSLITEAGYRVAQTGESALISWSVPWEATSLVPFLKHAKGAPRIYWGSSREDIGFAGYGVAALLTASGPRRFIKIQEKSQRLFSNLILIGETRPAGVIPRLFGGFGFDPDPDPLSLWSGFGAASFVLPRYLLSRYSNQIWLTVNHQLRPDEDIAEICWLFTEQVDMFREELTQARAWDRSESLAPHPHALTQVPTSESWEDGVSDAISQIKAGRLQKVVLARGIQLESDQMVDPAQALIRLGERYPTCYRFLYEPVTERAFFGATPELLISVSGKTAETVGLAGSAPRGKTEAADQKISKALQSNPKELQEHYLVVESIIQQLTSFAESIEASDVPGIRKLENIQHLETPIRVKLKMNFGVLPLVEALHPTPAVGGVPQDQALQLIKTIEPITRGWYASPVGWIDHQGDGLFTVAIRSVVSVGQEAMLYAGAGIVRESDPKSEWTETGLKFKPILDALGVTEAGNGD